jgi:putative membrane protein
MEEKPMPIALNKIVAASAGSLLAFLSSEAWAETPSDADKYFYGPHMMWWDGGYGMILGPLFMIVLLAVVVAAVVLLARWTVGPWPRTFPPHQMPPGRTPIDILKERFARGEIDKDEFEQRRRVLGD